VNKLTKKVSSVTPGIKISDEELFLYELVSTEFPGSSGFYKPISSEKQLVESASDRYHFFH